MQQQQSDDKSKNDSIKIVSRGHIPPAPAKGASRAAKMRAVARGEDTASTLKHEQQVRCFNWLLLMMLLLLLLLLLLMMVMMMMVVGGGGGVVVVVVVFVVDDDDDDGGGIFVVKPL